MAEIVTKISDEEISISREVVETVNVSEISSELTTVKQEKEAVTNMYNSLINENTTNRDNAVANCDSKIAILEEKLAKASTVWVVPTVAVEETPVVEETTTEPTTETTTEVQYDPIDWSIIQPEETIGG